MDKETYFYILNLYKKEKNIKRLVYRLIKGKYEEDKRKRTNWLSQKEIIYVAERIIYTKEEIFLEKERIHNEKIKLLNSKIDILKEEGYRDITILEDYTVRYKEKDIEYYNYINFVIDINNINNSYFKKTKESIIEAINFLISIGYIEGCLVKNTHPKVKKTVNLGKTLRFKPIK